MNESQCKIHKKCKFFYNSIHEGFNNTADSAKFSHNINHSIIMIIGYKITMKVRLEMTLNNRYNRLIKKVKSINCAFLIEIRVIIEFTT